MTSIVSEKRMQPSLQELLNRYLSETAPSQGVSNRLGMVEPYEVQGAFRPDVRQTWRDSTNVMEMLGLSSEKMPAPPEWDSFTELERTLPLLPIGFGLFPQRVSASIDWTGELKNSITAVPGFSRLRDWLDAMLSNEQPKPMLIASGIAATLGDSMRADQLIQQAEHHCKSEWQAAWQNQKDVIAFLSGQSTDGLFQANRRDTLSRFNQGIQALQNDDSSMAQTAFESATSAMPETSSWHQLAKLYQSVAEMRNQS